MITECNEDNINQVFDYIGDDYEKCLYLYIDLRKYGLTNENFSVWIQYDGNEICGLISQYHNGIQIYSKNHDLIYEELLEFIKDKNPTVISGMGDILLPIRDEFADYSETLGSVAKLTELKYPPDPNAYSAPMDELDEIAKLLVQEDNLGKHTGYDLLYQQLCERKKDNFGRNFISRDENNDIICHAATYAELPELAVVSGVMTSFQYRGKGFSKGTLAALCDQLLSEGKVVFSYFHIPPAIKMHQGVGFKEIGKWMKFKKEI
ncbi:GNAT family N-acetyltransferase [Methanobrevibacter sp.]|uniref:GNAT family N-acetyltransferase n=1 Tax=Methanobrevibacter sp. TaxID=66852 RepID=UPI003890FF2F